MKLQGKVAIVTGGAGGVGRASALKIAEEGGKVVVADLDIEHGQETVDLIHSSGGKAIFHETDVTQYEEVEGLVHQAVEQYGALHVMFNNAGLNIFNPLLEYKPEDYDKVIRVNQHGVFYGILAAGRKMSELGTKGVIINTASVGSFIAIKNSSIAYLASKAAVKLMTQTAAMELGTKGIRVVGVAPAATETEFIKFRMEQNLGLNEMVDRTHIRKKLLKPEEIAQVVSFLASDEADVINGTTVLADDGMLGYRL